MTYLLAKYAFLFLLASLFGIALGYWLSRRNMVDVSESYEELRAASARSDAALWDKLWQRLDALPEPKETDLSGVMQRIDAIPQPKEADLSGVLQRIDAIPQPKETDLTEVYRSIDGIKTAVDRIPRPEPVNLSAVEEQLASLEARVLAIPVPETPERVDLGPIENRIGQLETILRNLPKPPEPEPVNLAPVNERIERVEKLIGEQVIPEVDLQPIQQGIAQVRRDIDGLPVVETHPAVDIGPLAQQFAILENRVANQAPAPAVNLSPLEDRLKSVEAELQKLRGRLERPAKTPSVRPKPARKEPVILSAALYGKKDDLKRISGVGPKLERLLNKNGVYYFWQVASWNRSDVKVIDDRLDVFKGRIDRDEWVKQAKSLRREPGVAQMPAEY